MNKILEKIKSSWDFKATPQENALRFNNEFEQARKKSEKLRKIITPLIFTIGVVLTLITQNPIFAFHFLYLPSLLGQSMYLIQQPQAMSLFLPLTPPTLLLLIVMVVILIMALL